MNLYALSGLLNGLTSTLVGVYVFTRDLTDRRYQTYALFCLTLSVWSYGYFFWHQSQSSTEALLWVKVLMTGAILIPVTNFHHILELLQWPADRKRWLWVGYFLCVPFLLLNLFSNLFVEGVSPKLDFPYWPDPGPAFHVYLAFFFYCLAHFTYLLIREARNSIGIRQNQMKYLVFALVVGYAGGSTNFPLWYGISLAPYGNLLVSVYIVLFSYAVVKFHLLDINVVIKRSLIYTFLLLVLLVPCYLLVMWGQMVAFGKIHYTFSLGALLLLIVIGFLFPKLRFRTEEAFERVLFKRRYDYRDTLLRSSRDMVSVVDLEVISQNLVLTVVKALGIDKASLYLLDEVKGSFEVKSSTGLFANSSGLPILSRDDLLIRRLTSNRGALVREELHFAADGAVDKDLARKMGEINAEVTLPLVTKEKLIGLLNLGYKEGKEMYSDEDLELLSTLANQAAIAIENARLYENLKQSQSIIRRGDRLASLGQLTAGLAHEIRNPLVAIRTFTQLLPERYQDPEFRSSFQALAMKEVDRICGLVNDLLSFARPSPPNVSAENVNEIVESIARILETEAKEKGVQIYRRLAPSLPKIFVDKEQIKQVCMNVILNAIQAIDGRGVVQISTHLFAKNGGEQFVQIGIRDSGLGIAEKDLENIFNPFFTTKKEGSGLGLSISHQIVQEHGGYITVESKAGEGTTFFINLPAHYRNHQGITSRNKGSPSTP